jgi:hypothetical protein
MSVVNSAHNDCNRCFWGTSWRIPKKGAASDFVSDLAFEGKLYCAVLFPEQRLTFSRQAGIPFYPGIRGWNAYT